MGGVTDRVDLGNPGLALLVRRATGVVYEHQAGGYLCSHPSAEGFLVPLGFAAAAEPFQAFFRRRFHGWPPFNGEPWPADALAELKALVASVHVWYGEPGEEQPLTLDESRLDELTEAWVPVDSPFGSGILVFDNSD